MAIHISIGTSTADSYVSVASADAYFDAIDNNDTWKNISLNASTGTLATQQKENLLKQSTRELDTFLRFVSGKYNTGIIGATDYQALEFPRINNVDNDNALYIPDDVKYATYEQSDWIMERGGVRTSSDGTQAKKEQIGTNAWMYIKGWATRQIKTSGLYPWQTRNTYRG